MPTVPLHPALVHLPLVLAMLAPLVVGAALWRVFGGHLERGVRIAVAVAYALLVAGGIVSLKTGEGDEERVEKVVAESHLGAHEAAAQLFVAAGAVVLALAMGFAFVGTAGAAKASGVAVAIGSIVVAGLALRTGKLGGELVYVHGAAAAFAQAGTGGAPEGAPATAPKDDDDD